jgi:hypothetical protein
MSIYITKKPHDVNIYLRKNEKMTLFLSHLDWITGDGVASPCVLLPHPLRYRPEASRMERAKANNTPSSYAFPRYTSTKSPPPTFGM